MHIAFFGHSILADWDNGRAHFVRGLMRELGRLGHEAVFYEAKDNLASRTQVSQIGQASLMDTLRVFPFLRVRLYRPSPDPQPFLRQALAEADAAVVMQGSEPALVRALPQAADAGQACFFYDATFRLLREDPLYRSLGLERYDAVLAASGGLAAAFRERLRLGRVEVLHDGADTELFYPRPCRQDIDVLLIANGGADLERPLKEFFLEQSLLIPHLRFCLYGVRHGEQARQQFRSAFRVDYRGWVPNAQTPPLYARSRLAMHLCREPGHGRVDGPPLTRPLEAFATRTCLVAGPWRDDDGLFTPGEHYLQAEMAQEMTRLIRYLLENRPARERIAEAGYRHLLTAHTCRHRAEELVALVGRYVREGRTAALTPCT